MKILVIKFRNIGDILLSTPLLANLRHYFPEANIDYATNDECIPIIEDNPLVDNLISFERKKNKKLSFLDKVLQEIKILKMIRTNSYDVVLNLTEGDRGALYTLFSGAKNKFSIKPSNYLISNIGMFTSVIENNFNIHTVEKDLQFIPLLNKEIVYKKLSISWPSQAEQGLFRLLPEEKAQDYVVIHPVSRWMFKCWNNEEMAKVIDYIILKKNVSVILTGSSAEIEMNRIDEILNLCHSIPIVLSGKLSLKELSFLISRAKLFFGVDSAPMHIASACDIKVLALFGASSPLCWGPWYDGKRKFKDIDGIQFNNFHYIISNMNHEIYYENGIKKTRGMDNITFQQVKSVLNKIL